MTDARSTTRPHRRSTRATVAVLVAFAALALAAASLGAAAASSIVFSGNGAGVDRAPYQGAFTSLPTAPTSALSVTVTGTPGTVGVSWSGGSASCTSGCTGTGVLSFTPTTEVTISATPPGSGATAEISGACSADASTDTITCTTTMSGDKSVSVAFVP